MKKKILVIDDEELIVKSITKLLNKHGYEVIVCRSSDEGINVIKNESVDLIISDIRMPKKSGMEMIKEVRLLLKTLGRDAIPEIIVTGYADDQAMEEAQRLRVAEYIYKPFDLNDFLRCVRKSIGD